MKRDIIIGVISSLVGALIAFLASSAFGLFEKTITDSQVRELASTIVDQEQYRNVLLDNIEVPDLTNRVKSIETAIGSLAQQRGNTELPVTNPSRGGHVAACPAGTFVSRVRASKGVGGKYATDGISEIRVTCSPIR